MWINVFILFNYIFAPRLVTILNRKINNKPNFQSKRDYREIIECVLKKICLRVDNGRRRPCKMKLRN